MREQSITLSCGDCLEVMRSMLDQSVDLVVGSPPYEKARTYGIDFNLSGAAWVQWSVERYIECLRISRGLVAWVVEGQGAQTVDWSCTPIMFMAELRRRGVALWKPSIYGRFSTPGRFTVLRNNWEWVVCSSNARQLPFSDPTACGSAPTRPPGGRTRPRKADGSRNLATKDYKQPERTNVGNIIWCGAVGGGNMGHELASENEAPYPLYLAEVLVRSFTKPGDTVFDPFLGSGTTAHACALHDRDFIGVDVRESQLALTWQRLQTLRRACWE